MASTSPVLGSMLTSAAVGHWSAGSGKTPLTACSARSCRYWSSVVVGQLVGVGVEVVPGRGLDAVLAVPEVDRVQVVLEDLLLLVLLLDREGGDGRLRLAAGRLLGRQEGVLRPLLGDGRRPLDDP